MTLPVPPPPSRAGRSVWGDGSPRPGLAGALLDALAVVAGAGRLLARHWPALIAIFLTGMVLRELIMRAAVRISFYNAELGMLVLLFAPMTTLTVLVLMLRVVRPSLPWLGQRGKPPSVLIHLGSVLVPFMTIYLFEDDLREDMLDYSYRVWEDFFNQTIVGLGESVDTGLEQPDIPSTLDRLPFDLSLPLAAVVVAAIVGRWLLGRWPATERRGWLGLPGAYLELVWITLVMVLAFQAVSDLVVEWSETRRLGSAIWGIWEHGIGTASGATSAPEAGIEWLLGQVSQVETVLIIPLSWLAIGAVVIGHRSRAPATDRPVRGSEAYDRAQRRWAAAPRAVRWTGERLTEDLRDRFTPLVRGVRLLVRAGAVPMLLFCLAFVAARRLSDWLWQLERTLVGPQDTLGVWFPLAWPLSTVNEAIGTAVLICLLAVAVDRALHHSEPQAGAPQPAGTAAEELPVTATVPPAPSGPGPSLPPPPPPYGPASPLPPPPPPYGPGPPVPPPPPPYGPGPPLPPPSASQPVAQPTPIRT